MQKLENIYLENDKINAPFLLAASFQGYIQFIRSEYKNGILYWKFSTPEQAQKLLTQLRTKTEPPIPAKDLFDAISSWWQEIAEMKQLKNGGIYGNRQ